MLLGAIPNGSLNPSEDSSTLPAARSLMLLLLLQPDDAHDAEGHHGEISWCHPRDLTPSSRSHHDPSRMKETPLQHGLLPARILRIIQ